LSSRIAAATIRGDRPGAGAVAAAPRGKGDDEEGRQNDLPRPDSFATAEEDARPHEQRAPGPRPARRLNHAFRHLYRRRGGDEAESEEEGDPAASPDSYLISQGFTKGEIDRMRERFPRLLELSAEGQVAPMLRFLRHTLQLDLRNETERGWIPPELLGVRLEAVVAPRHAFLVHAGLRHGRELLAAPSPWQPRSAPPPPSTRLLLHEFVASARRSAKRFAAFCQALNRHPREGRARLPPVYPVITGAHVEAFQFVFSRGLLAAARNDLVQAPPPPSSSASSNNVKWNPLEIVNRLTSAELARLLVQHGANPRERDYRGATLLHWACGTGNLDAARVLAEWVPADAAAERDGAGCLHWAAAGATPREFGVGGHPEVCRFLMERVREQEREARSLAQSHPTGASVATASTTISTLREYVNRPTKDGNTPLMWAAWSGTIETVKLLVRSRADPSCQNRNGCTVAHWAASGGNLEVCRYLRDVAGADFALPNRGGNTPLSHAVAFGRAEVVEWLRREVLSPAATDAAGAASLARDFVRWTGGEHGDRNRVLQLLDEWGDGEASYSSQVDGVDQTREQDILLW
jgi:ankyrin repeat protein